MKSEPCYLQTRTLENALDAVNAVIYLEDGGTIIVHNEGPGHIAPTFVFSWEKIS